MYGPQYSVIGTDCVKAVKETMRLGSDGSLGIGGGVTEILEKYEFQTAEVAWICARLFNKHDDLYFKDEYPTCNTTIIGTASNTSSPFIFTPTPSPDWKCELFGTGSMGLCLVPSKDKMPNRFWMLMQYLILGNKWRYSGKNKLWAKLFK